jgi:DNA-binding XRE family transcriptional regulator
MVSSIFSYVTHSPLSFWFDTLILEVIEYIDGPRMILRQVTASTLKSLRLDAGLSQEQLARKSGIDRTYISGVERGVRNITLDSLETIVLALGVSQSEFVGTLHNHLEMVKAVD